MREEPRAPNQNVQPHSEGKVMRLDWVSALVIFGSISWVTSEASATNPGVTAQTLLAQLASHQSQGAEINLGSESSLGCSTIQDSSNTLLIGAMTVGPDGSHLIVTASKYSIPAPPSDKTPASGDNILDSNRGFIVKSWNLATGEEVPLLFEVPPKISEFYSLSDIAFMPDGETLVGVYHDLNGKAIVRLWQLKTRQSLRNIQVDFDPRNPSLGDIKVSRDGSTLIWIRRRTRDLGIDAVGLRNLETDRPIQILELNSPATDIGISSDNKLIATREIDGTIRVQNILTRRTIRTLTGSATSLGPLAVSSDGRLLFQANRDGSISVWDITTGKPIRTLVGHTTMLSYLAFSSNDKMLLSGGTDGAIKLWDVTDGRTIRTFCVE
jgi:WD40 repeat protein